MFRPVRRGLTVDCGRRRCAKFQVLNPVLQKIKLFWDFALCRLVNRDVLKDLTSSIFRFKKSKNMKDTNLQDETFAVNISS
jgi:hypothetical protein